MPAKKEKKLRGLRDYARIVVHQRKAPDAIALGVCIGLFAGLSPLYGLQIIVAFLLALLLRGSKIAAILSVWVTNPLTMVPVYSFTYWVGSCLLSSPVRGKYFREFIRYCIRHLRWESLEEARAVVSEALRLGRDILPPLFVGGLAVAAVSSLAVYPLTKRIVRRIRAARSLRIHAHGEKRRGHPPSPESV